MNKIVAAFFICMDILLQAFLGLIRCSSFLGLQFGRVKENMALVKGRFIFPLPEGGWAVSGRILCCEATFYNRTTLCLSVQSMYETTVVTGNTSICISLRLFHVSRSVPLIWALLLLLLF